MMAPKRLYLGFAAGTTLILAGLILVDGLPLLRGPAPETAEWYWPYLLRPAGRWWAPIAAALILLAVSIGWLRSRRRGRPMTLLALAGLALAHLSLQVALIFADRPAVWAELIDRTQSNLESGFFEPAAEIEDLHALLRIYPEAMPAFVSEHARTHPPGLLVANWLTIRLLATTPAVSTPIARTVYPARCIDLWLLDRPPEVAAALAAWAVMPLIAGALAVLLTYLFARQLLDEQGARLATVLVASLPALLLFAPKVVQLYPPLVIALFLALHQGLARQSVRWILASGLLFSLSTFLSLGNASLLLALAGYALLASRHNGRVGGQSGRQWPPIRFAATTVVAFAAGAASVWVAYWLGWGVPPWAIVRAGLQQHYELVTSLRRYEWWLVSNLVDLVLFAGLPLVVAWLVKSLPAVRNRRRLTPVVALGLALAALVVVLDLSGSVRGEVGRLWLFFMPLLAIPAAAFFRPGATGWRAVALVVGLQLLLAVSMGLAWRPVRAVNVVAQRPPMGADTPAVSLNVPFGQAITLAGYTVGSSQAGPGGHIDLTLYWAAGGPATRPYTVFTHLVDNQGTIVAQQDNWPVEGHWPPTCWQAGERVVDPYHLALPPGLPEGDYTLLVGLYDAADNSRLTTGDGQEAITLVSIRVES